MTSFFRSKKKQNLPQIEPEVEEEKVKGPNYVVFISVEKDLIVGAKKNIAVPLTLPALPDLELTYEVSVRRADIGVSATFIPDSDTSRASVETVDNGIIPPSPRNSATTITTTRQQSKEFERPEKGALQVLPYARIRRREVLDGVFRFEGQSGRLVFSLDNTYSKTRRKRVLIKLTVESINPEADKHELEAELKQIDELRAAVLAQQPDPSGYLESDMNVKRFLDARPTFDEALKMLSNTLRWRNEGRYFLPGGCPICRTLPGSHVWRQVGFDKERRPVIFFSLSQVIPRVRLAYRPFDLLVHLINLLENGHKTMEPGAACGFTWIMDLQGMTWADCRLLGRVTGEMEEGISKDGTEGGKKETFISVLADHFPQTLGSALMFRPPVFLFQIWKAVKAFMDPKTAKAYYFVRTPAQVDEALAELFDQELGDWIRKEIGLIQAEPVNGVDDKIYRGPSLWKPDTKNGHDPRGSSEYVSRFCKPVSERAEGLDKLHQAHPNICQMIEKGSVGGEDVEAAVQPVAGSLFTSKEKRLSGGGAEEEGKLTPKQEREEARKMLGITMRQIKAAVDADFTANSKGGNVRNARKRTGISYETLERLANPVMSSLESPDGKESEELEKMIDEILQEEMAGENSDEDVSDEGSDDDDVGSIEASSMGSFYLQADSGVSPHRKSGDSQRQASMRRVVIPSRLVHVEKITMDESCPSVSWSFQVESGDVGFVATFVRAGSEEKHTVTPWSRCRNRLVHTGEWEISPKLGGNGVLTLNWDNSYSRIRPKAITFSISR